MAVKRIPLELESVRVALTINLVLEAIGQEIGSDLEQIQKRVEEE